MESSIYSLTLDLLSGYLSVLDNNFIVVSFDLDSSLFVYHLWYILNYQNMPNMKEKERLHWKLESEKLGLMNITTHTFNKVLSYDLAIKIIGGPRRLDSIIKLLQLFKQYNATVVITTNNNHNIFWPIFKLLKIDKYFSQINMQNGYYFNCEMETLNFHSCKDNSKFAHFEYYNYVANNLKKKLLIFHVDDTKPTSNILCKKCSEFKFKCYKCLTYYYWTKNKPFNPGKLILNILTNIANQTNSKIYESLEL